DARDVAARVRQTLGQSCADWIDCEHHYREFGSPLGRNSRGITERYDDIDLARHQFVQESSESLDVPLRPATLEYQISTKLIATSGEPAHERCPKRTVVGDGCRSAEQANAVDVGPALVVLGSLPEVRREDCSAADDRHAAEQNQELPPAH